MELFRLFYYGAGTVPRWVTILLAAEDWGVPPWTIAKGMYSEVQWLNRWSWLRAEKSRAEKKRADNGSK